MLFSLPIRSQPSALLCLLAVCGGIPESPRFLFTRGRIQEATEVLRVVAQENGTPCPQLATPVFTSNAADHAGNIGGLMRTHE